MSEAKAGELGILQKKIVVLKKKLKEARIGEGILFSLISEDSWDLYGDKEEVMETNRLTSKEYDYLKRRLSKTFFQKYNFEKKRWEDE